MPNKITTFRHFIKNATNQHCHHTTDQFLFNYYRKCQIVSNMSWTSTHTEKLPPFQTLKEIQTPSDHCFRLTEILNENWISHYHNIDNLIFCIRCLILMLVLSSVNKSLRILSVMTCVSYTLFWTGECLQRACRAWYEELIELMIMNGASDWNCGLKTACIGGKEMIVNYMIEIVA